MVISVPGEPSPEQARETSTQRVAQGFKQGLGNGFEGFPKPMSERKVLDNLKHQDGDERGEGVFDEEAKPITGKPAGHPQGSRRGVAPKGVVRVAGERQGRFESKNNEPKEDE